MRRASLLMALAIVALLATGCAGDDVPSSSSPTSPAPSASPDPSRTPPPPSVEPTQSGTYWAVYLAAGDPDSESFITRVEMLEDKGLPSHGSEASCDQGSREALGLKETDHVIGVYFDREADAKSYAATLDFTPAGIVQVQTYCLD